MRKKASVMASRMTPMDSSQVVIQDRADALHRDEGIVFGDRVAMGADRFRSGLDRGHCGIAVGERGEAKPMRMRIAQEGGCGLLAAARTTGRRKVW